MKIDCHVHITPPEISKNWEKFAEKEIHFAELSKSRLNKFASAEDVVLMLEQNNFDRAVVFGFGFCDLGLCRYVNDFVIESVKKFPEKLIGFSVVPGCGDAVQEIERCYSAGLKGVGELFPGFGFDIENERELSGACKELGIPLLLHANESIGHSYPGKTDISLKQLERFIVNNPGLKIILAHFGGGLLLHETVKQIRESFRDVFYDTAAAPFFYDSQIYRVIKTLGMCEKILFGSDFPLLPHSRTLPDIKAGGFTGEELCLILGKNAEKLLI